MEFKGFKIYVHQRGTKIVGYQAIGLKGEQLEAPTIQELKIKIVKFRVNQMKSFNKP